MCWRTLLKCTSFSLIAALSAATFAVAQIADDHFYEGKTISVVVTTASGSGYDLGTRVFARHFGKHIPGNPTVVVQNRPGAGGRVGTTYVGSVAPQDGTVVGALQSFIVLDPLFDESMRKRFDPLTFNWLGSVASTASVAVAWHTASIASYRDLFERELIVGGVGTATPMVTLPHLLNRLLGTKFKVVTGYEGGNAVNLAMMRGEIQGRADYSWNSLSVERADWLKEGKIKLLFQIGLRPHKDIVSVPLLVDMAKTPEDRAILEASSLSYELGRSFMVAQNVPADRIAILRRAFQQTMDDPAFQKEAAASNIEVDPVPPEKLHALVAKAYQTPKELIARIRELQKSAD
jgi:tripartite-type tricarboxylate transporter receptor subunit TctC